MSPAVRSFSHSTRGGEALEEREELAVEVRIRGIEPVGEGSTRATAPEPAAEGVIEIVEEGLAATAVVVVHEEDSQGHRLGVMEINVAVVVELELAVPDQGRQRD